MSRLKIVFMGTPDFSAEVLSALAAEHDVAAVVTGPDKPVGRGYTLTPSPLKVRAMELGIPVLQFEKVSRDGLEAVAALKPDLGVTAAFGQILSDGFLALFPEGVINVHASLLPKYRGASPIQWAVLNGDKETGVTIMRTVKEVDAGDILLQKRTPIGEKETAGTLFDRLAVLGGEALCEAVRLIESGEEHFDFVEVMACPTGCIGGAGQPEGFMADKVKRSQGLYTADKGALVKRSDENPVVMQLYEDGLLKYRAHELLHVHYGAAGQE